MTVLLDGRKYRIDFRHDLVDRDSGRGDGGTEVVHRERTTCLILDVTAWPDGRAAPPTAGQGTVIRYFRDAPNRELARKYALKKAVDNLIPRRCCAGCLHNRQIFVERRRALWEAYLNRKQSAGQAQAGSGA